MIFRLVNYIDEQCEVEVVVVGHLSIRKMHKMNNNINKVGSMVRIIKRDWFAVSFGTNITLNGRLYARKH